jgi:hypothetical protein
MFFETFSINCKVYMFKGSHKLKMFLHVQSIQTSKVPKYIYILDVVLNEVFEI